MAEFKTPVKQTRNIIAHTETPIIIPPSPFLKKLGYGTGIFLHLYLKYPVFIPVTSKKIDNIILFEQY